MIWAVQEYLLGIQALDYHNLTRTISKHCFDCRTHVKTTSLVRKIWREQDAFSG